MDLNGDGYMDLLSGSWPGEIYLFRGGEGHTFAPPEMIKDKEGYYINIGGGVQEQPDGTILVTGNSEEEKTDEGRFFKCGRQRIPVKPDQEVWSTGTASAVHAADWDGDGDYDLLIGDIRGRLFLVANEGTKTEPSFGRESPLRTGLFVPVKVDGDAGPFVIDWDGDGDHDLLVGSGDGSVVLFRNAAPKGGPPALGLPEQIIPPGHVAYGDDVPAEPRRGHRSKICPVDWNGDGRLDLLVGDYTTQKPDLPEPTAEEKAEHDRLRKERERLRMEYYTSYDKLRGADRGLEEAERKRLEEEFRTLQEKMQKLDARIPPEYESHGWVWLFLRKPAQS
ncbi:MAG: FG-GAP repeat domain-containing protein [Planctomycetota bacterium]